ncbi:MAG: membrane-bound lytic murein transglycosylase MltF [Alteromonas sp.]|jgi:membrane-bound lytic murein transglycosylase F|uniref:membrane-bound lytic murein transglycosylase MltF n=1 Tax=Alteromonas sp. TaxID=232 RepID=UPI0032D9506B
MQSLWKMLFFAVIVFSLAACEKSPNGSQANDSAAKAGKKAANSDIASSELISQIKASGVLKVITRNAPTTYFIGRDILPKGPEFDMAEAFASHLGVELEIIEKPSIQAVIAALRNKEGHIAAAGLTQTKARAKEFMFGPNYQDITQQVVCRRDNVQPEAINELIGLNIMVAEGTAYSERLKELKEQYPTLSWVESSELSTEQILYKVWQREIDCSVADSNIVDLNRRYFPELIAPFNLARSENLAWMLHKSSAGLSAELDNWYLEYEKSGRLESMLDQYYGFFEVFDYVDTRTFIRRVEKRFPEYTQYFSDAATKYKLPFHLLAAQAYQESHWLADAISPTGVRGIMMLTQKTAKEVGVKNRLNPKQSIFGGARYLAKIRTHRFVDEVKEPDRTWLALAAYNVGRAHLHDAQILARKLNLNPHKWADMKQVLPLLSEKRYYKDLRYGYARGTEPVRYVQRIREYQHIIENELD